MQTKATPAVTLQGRFAFSPTGLLGEGCAAKVYEGKDLKCGKAVAVKIYKDTGRMCLHCLKNCIHVSGALQKARVQGERFTHRGLFVELLGSSLDSSGAPGIEGGRLFSILELGGESLEDALGNHYSHGKSGFPLTELRDLHWSLVSIVNRLHSLRLVHLDIKPSNLVRFHHGGKSQWKLIDLDCVTSTEAVSRFGDITFTMPYMAPELARKYLQAGPGRAQHCPVILTSAMDLWSAGVCALEAVVLSSPLTDRYLKLQQSGDNEFLTWLSCEEPLLSNEVMDVLANVHPEMQSLLAGMLIKDPASRFHVRDCIMHQFFKPIRAEVQTSPSRSRSMQLPDHPGRANCRVSGVKDARLMTERPKLAQLPSLPKAKLESSARRPSQSEMRTTSSSCVNM